MRYSDLRKEINEGMNEVHSMQDYCSVYLNADMASRLDKLTDKYVYHLFEDLSKMEINKDLESFLGGKYRNIDEYAKDCVQMVYTSEHLFGLKVKNWTDSPLKCFDGFLLVLIQEILKEKIKKRLDVGVERQKYWHLIEKGGQYYDIGFEMDMVYGERNKFTHVEIIEIDGIRRQLPLSKKKMKKSKKIILESFKKALVALEKQIVKRDN
jgi:hypothetical protein